MSDLNTIKKILYKEKPKAFFQYVRKGDAYYKTKTSEGEINFKIPVTDMGEADFGIELESSLLMRWIMI